MAYPKPHQIAKLHRQVKPIAAYLYQVRDRLERMGVAPTDELYRAVQRAHDGVYELSTVSFYRSGITGVGRPAEESDPGA